MPANIKAALKIANAMHSGPQTMSQAIWDEARRHYSEQEVVDIVLLAMHGAGSKVAVTLGLEPGPQASSRLFFPAEKCMDTLRNSSARSRNSSGVALQSARPTRSTTGSTSESTNL